MPNKETLNFTPEQLGAIDSQKTPAVIEAGAGSGKTTVLVRRVRDIIKKNPDLGPEEILLITFTENAVRDIKRKLRELDPETFSSLLLPSKIAAVYTFHGFANLILREHPAFFALDPDFSILDETDATTFYRDSFLEFITDEEIYSRRNNSKRTRDISQALKRLLSHFTPQALNMLILTIYDRRHLFHTNMKVKEILKDYACTSCEDILHTILNALQNTAAYRKNLEALQSISPKDCTDKLYLISREILPPVEKPFEYINNIIKGFPAFRGGSEKNYENGDFQRLKAALAFFKEIFSCLSGEHLDMEKNRLSMRLSCDTLLIFSAFSEFVQRKKDHLNILDFSDLEIFAARVTERPSIPAYYNKRYRYVLIDEFHDTSRIQKNLLYSLFPANKLVIVGDPRQSIYRFRNADVSIFSEVSRDLLISGEKIFLETNFRSHPNLLFFFNRIFNTLFNLSPDTSSNGSDWIKALISNFKRPQIYPGVLLPGERQKCRALSGEINIITYSMPENPETASFEYEARIVAAKVQEFLRKGLELRDITILLHSMTHSQEIQSALENNSIPFHMIDSAGLFDTFEVSDIVNLLKASLRPSDNLSLLAALKSNFFSITDQDLIDIFESSDTPCYFEKLKAMESCTSRLKTEIHYLRELTELITHVPLIDFATHLLENNRFREKLFNSPEPDRRLANIDKFLSLVAIHEQSMELKDIDHWIRYLDSLREKELRIGTAQVMGENENCVKIMTIHKAKGLEFSTVIIPFCGNNPTGKAPDFLFKDGNISFKTYEDEKPFQNLLHFVNKSHDSLENSFESLRLFYVALTRTMDNLVITGKLTKTKKPLSLSMKWIETLRVILNLDSLMPGTHRVIAKIPTVDHGRETTLENDFSFNYLHLTDSAVPDMTPSDLTLSKAQVKPPPGEPKFITPYHLPPESELSEIRVVALQHYANCPRYYFLRYVASLPEDDSFQGGSSSEFQKNHIKKHTPGKLKANIRGQILHRLFESFADPSFPGTGIEEKLKESASHFGETPSPLEINSLLNEAFLFHRSPYLERLRKSSQTLIEYPFLLQLKSRIKGTIDRIDLYDNEIIITDYKSTALPEQNLKRDHFQIQADIYALAASKLFPGKPVSFNIYFTKNGEPLTIPSGSPSLENAEREINLLIDKIRAEEFERKEGTCEHCLLKTWCATSSQKT